MKKLIWINLAIRLVLAAVVVHTQHWLGGDSLYYLDQAARVCGGYWGGDQVRTPGYEWLICLLSPTGIIFAQTITVWLAGVWLSRRATPTITAFWLFDPGLLVYSTVFMSDALFACGVLALGLCIEPYLSRKPAARSQVGYGLSVLLGLAFAFTILMRIPGIPLAVYTALFFVYSAIRKRTEWRKLAVTAAITLSLLAPRLYWNHSRIGQWTLATQGSTWFDAIAAFVLYDGTGIDPIQSELKFLREFPNRDHAFAYHVVLEHLPTYLKLVAKSVGRVLIGHVNSEWFNFFVGEPPIGPGWFKPTSQPGHYHVAGWWVLPWVLGIFLAAAFCLYAYYRTFRALKSAWPLDSFCYWCLGGIFMLTLLPQVWGDARFRTSMWPLVLLLWARGERLKQPRRL